MNQKLSSFTDLFSRSMVFSFFTLLMCITIHAQTSDTASSASLSSTTARQPSTTTEKYVITTKRELAALHQKLEIAKRKDLVGARGGLQTLMYVAREENKLNEAELHDASDDYHIVLEGAARFIVGGKLEGAREKTVGEWRGGRIVGGQTIELKKGDVLFVPRGTPHQRDTTKRDYTAMLIKIYAIAQPVKAELQR